MRGFDPTFRDYPEYLNTVSTAIWARRGLGQAITGYCHDHLILRRSEAIGFGQGPLRSEIMELTAALPGLRTMPEDVIWSGTPQLGMLGSQRMVLSGHHDGYGLFGAPTGQRLRFRVMADLYAKDNRISDGWMVRDTGAVLRQLGIKVSDWSRDRLAAADPEFAPFRPEVDAVGPYTGRGNANQWGAAFGAMISDLMQSEFSAIPEQYDPAARLTYPGGKDVVGCGGAERFWLGLRAAFPSARFAIHHQSGLEERQMPPRAALRWSLSGGHDGWGGFGRPTGAEVHVMGISHAEFGPGGLRREWTLFDETAVWMQIHSALGAGARRGHIPDLAAV